MLWNFHKHYLTSTQASYSIFVLHIGPDFKAFMAASHCSFLSFGDENKFFINENFHLLQIYLYIYVYSIRHVRFKYTAMESYLTILCVIMQAKAVMKGKKKRSLNRAVHSYFDNNVYDYDYVLYCMHNGTLHRSIK